MTILHDTARVYHRTMAAMNTKKVLFWAGTLVSIAAAIISVASLDDKSLNPISAVGLGIAALALFKGSEVG